MLQKRANEIHGFRNTLFTGVYEQNTALYWFKMSQYGAFWLADLWNYRTGLRVCKRTPFFGMGYQDPRPMKTYSPQTPFLRWRLRSSKLILFPK